MEAKEGWIFKTKIIRISRSGWHTGEGKWNTDWVFGLGGVFAKNGSRGKEAWGGWDAILKIYNWSRGQTAICKLNSLGHREG